MRKFILLVLWAAFCSFELSAQTGFTSITPLSPVEINSDTGDKPQAKVWQHAGKHWAVLASTNGTHLWRLDGTTWTNVLRLSTKTSSKADCKVVGDITHIFLYQGASSQFVSVEYVPSASTYQLWSRRTNTVGLSFESGVETATIDMDGNGRMWLASAGVSDINVRWSDSPYNTWSAPIPIATGVNDDDICAVVALPGKIGVFWSNQTTKRFGFKTHADGASPSTWSADEVPASQSALNIGGGMGDDHMNLIAASDGTLYCGVKTSYNTNGYPAISMLVRRPTGSWDNLYEITQNAGTRPIVVLNENSGKVRVVYTTVETGGNIVYKESSTSSISFGSQLTMISGTYNDATSIKGTFNPEVVVLASNSTHAVGVLAKDGSSPTAPPTPTLVSPANLSTGVSVSPTLSWNASNGATSYQVQVSTASNFSTIVSDQSVIGATSALVANLAYSTTYYWRVRASVTGANSAWSTVWSFTTMPQATPTGTLVGHWKMDEGSGTTLLDASSYSNNATTSGGPIWVEGVSGKALKLNGSTQFASVPDNSSLDITGALTLAAWIRPEQAATQYVIKKAEQNSTDGYELSLSSGGNIFFRFNQKTSGDTYRINSTTSYPTNGTTWMHVAVTYDGAVMRMYVNGVQNTSKTLSSPPAIMTNALSLSIASGSDGYRSLKGSIDEARVYNTALSASDISALANGTTPTLASVPVLSSPANAATGVSTSPTLSWNASTGADSYQAQVSTSSGFSTTVFDKSGITTTSTAVAGLANGTVYYWRARATNSAGSSDWSAVWSFTTAPAESTSDGTLIAFGSAWKYLDDGSNQGTAWKAASFSDGSWKSGSGKFGYGTSDAATVVNYGPDPNNKYVTTYFRKSFSITDVTALSDFKVSAKRDDGIIVYVNGSAVWRTGFPSGTVYYNTLAYESKDNGTTIQTVSISSSAFRTGTNVIAVEVHQAALNSPDMAFDLQLSATVAPTATLASTLMAAPQQMETKDQLTAYPNPFSSTATISFALPEDGAYSLALFDSKGAMVSVLKQGIGAAGETNKIELNSSGLAKGLYIIRLQTSGGMKTHKLVLER
jgi:hypothetical protein